MDVKSVCLGMLTDGPASGYDLKKQFESVFGHFFAAGFGSIYPALSAMAVDGLVRCEEIAQNGKPDRKLYSITAAGREALARALDNPTPGHKLRSEFLATLFFAHLMTPEQIETVLNNRLREVDECLEILNEVEGCECDRMPAGARFVAGFGRAIATASRRYIEAHRDDITVQDSPTDVEEPAAGAVLAGRI